MHLRFCGRCVVCFGVCVDPAALGTTRTTSSPGRTLTSASSCPGCLRQPDSCRRPLRRIQMQRLSLVQMARWRTRTQVVLLFNRPAFHRGTGRPSGANLPALALAEGISSAPWPPLRCPSSCIVVVRRSLLGYVEIATAFAAVRAWVRACARSLWLDCCLRIVRAGVRAFAVCFPFALWCMCVTHRACVRACVRVCVRAFVRSCFYSITQCTSNTGTSRLNTPSCWRAWRRTCCSDIVCA